MKISKIATIEVKLDERRYADEVGQMWNEHECNGAPEPSFPCGYGRLGEAIQQISFKLSCETNLDLECDNSVHHLITLSGGSEEQYTRYADELAYRIAAAQLDRWAQVT